MGQARETDAGLKYLMDIGFKRIRGKYGLSDHWQKIFGKAKTDILWKQWKSLKGGSPELYEFKNSDPEISKSFVEAYDGDIIRKACNYIADHKTYFGKTILEIGCDAGYMTGFLARTFPNASIVSIDRCEAAISIAKKRMTDFGVTNVEFMHCELKDLEKKFDTVFCMRTIQENVDFSEMPFTGEALLYQIACYATLTEDYTLQLLSHINTDGNLCVFERVGHDPLMCGWLSQLSMMDCGLIPNTYHEYSCIEVESNNTFQAFICKPGVKTELGAIYTLWREAMQMNYKGVTSLTGWNALAYLHENAGKLIRGVRVFDKDDEQVGRFVAFHDKDGEPLIYYLAAAGGSEYTLYSYAEQVRDDLLKHLQDTINLNVRGGNRVEEIKPNDEWIEGITPSQE